MKKVIRKCQGCGQIFDRNNLIKITKSLKNGEIRINPPSSFLGRSLYLCYSFECLKTLIKKKRLIREFKLDKEKEAEITKELEEIISNFPR